MKSMLALVAGVAVGLVGWTAIASIAQAVPVGSEVGKALSEPEASALTTATYPVTGSATATPPRAATIAPTAAATSTSAAKTPAELAAERKAQADALRELAKTKAAVAARRPKTTFENTSVKEVLQTLSDTGHFSIVIDPALAEAGVDLDARTVSLKAGGLSYEDALNLVLPREAGYRIESGYIYVTTLEKSWLPLKVAVVSVRLHMQEIPDHTNAPRFEINSVTRNAATGGGGGAGGGLFGAAGAPAAAETPGRMTPERLIAFVKQFVKNSNDRRIAPWDDEGGPATIQYMNGQLVIAQTEAGLRAAVRILVAIE